MSRNDRRTAAQTFVRRASGEWAVGALGALSVVVGLVACGGGGEDVVPQTQGTAGVKTRLAAVVPAQALNAREDLGKKIFFDPTLSTNGNQSCASCHDPAAGWTGPNAALNAGGAVYAGSIATRFGNRKPPSSAYATESPILHFEIEKKQTEFIGGNFWDGRATGERLGNPAADQAQGPFLNPLEQALEAAGDVVARICSGGYADLFVSVWGVDACDLADPSSIAQAYDRVALSIASYEASPESNAYTSKYDYYLKGMAELTKQEKLGLNMFKGKGKCSGCHELEAGDDGKPPLLTDFTYDNLGLPRNPDNPFYLNTAYNPLGYGWVDMGLGSFLASRGDYQAFAAQNDGKHKVPTLRNVDQRPGNGFVKAYGHNGYFKSLKGIVHFYNTRDAKPRCDDPFTREAVALAMNCWPAPEVADNVNVKELGNLHLTDAQVDALVAFMGTLSDGYQP